MAIVIRVNGNASGEGFLVAPDGARTFPVPLGLRTDDGTTIAATVQQAAGGATLVFSSANVSIGPGETFVDVHATSASGARNDTVLQVAVGGMVQATFNLTAIQNPEVWYQGRFQARFATDSDYYNDPRGTASGWNFALTGEPDFVPADSVPTTIGKSVGRQIRFHNPVALRSHVAPIGVSVNAVRATVGGSSQEWTTGDPLLGLAVDLGPNSYFAGNRPRNPADPLPAESYAAGLEPIGNFEIHLGNLFSGTSQTANDRPFAGGLQLLNGAETTQYGVPTLNSFNTTRKNQLIADFNALSPADQVGTPGLNLRTRIAHLGGDGGLGIPAQAGTLSGGFSGKEEYVGLVNGGVQFAPNNSTVLAYLAGYSSFTFFCKFLNYHSDEQCGQCHGSLVADTATAVPPFQNGVYDIQSREAAPFNALTVSQMTPAAVDAILAGGSVAEKVVVTVGSSYDRLVVSKAVIANPADPPANWTIASRGESLVGQFLPQASVFPRDLFYLVLPPGHQENVLGACEGTPFAPAPAVGLARLYAEGNVWKLLLHAGTNAADGVTYKGQWAGCPATVPTGCVAPDVELLNPALNFGTIEQGMVAYREIVLLNRSAVPVTITLPVLAPPFDTPGATSVTILPGEAGTLSVSFTAGAPGVSGPTPVSLSSNPIVGPLDVTLTGTSVAVATVDVVLVLDRSGSMSEPALTGFRIVSKSEVRNQAAQALVDLLRPGDRIGLVRFNQDAQPHMPLEVAGAEIGGMGRTDAATALGSVDLNPAGQTSIGDGMFEANAMLVPASAAARKAMVVLTDGVENSPQFINAVALGAGIKAYAIGLGLPQNVNVDKLSAVTGNAGGYLLITGELDPENEFRLHKYFVQILAGISADSIVVDPRAAILPGDTQRTPFYISEGDTQFDAVLFTNFPGLRFTLEAPDGTRVDPGNAAGFNGQHVVGQACRYYRMRMPTFPASATRALGKWHLVVDYPGPRTYRGVQAQEAARALAAQPDDKRRIVPIFNAARGYNVLVRARSAVQLEAGIEARGFGPGVDRKLIAYLRAFGRPLIANVSLTAHVTRPDGVSFLLPLRHEGNGRFEARLDDTKQFGSYSIVVRAAGRTPGNWPLQREQTLSGVVIDPTAKSEIDVRDQDTSDLLRSQQEMLKEALDRLERLFHDVASRGTAGGSWLAWLPWVVALFILLLLIIIWQLARQ